MILSKINIECLDASAPMRCDSFVRTKKRNGGRDQDKPTIPSNFIRSYTSTFLWFGPFYPLMFCCESPSFMAI